MTSKSTSDERLRACAEAPAQDGKYFFRLTGNPPCPHCGQPEGVKLHVGATGYSVTSGFQHAPECKANFCPHGIGWSEDCGACDMARIEGRRGMMTLNRAAYQRIIDEDLAWLDSVPRTLERDHVIAIVRASLNHEYPRACAEARPSTAERYVETETGETWEFVTQEISPIDGKVWIHLRQPNAVSYRKRQVSEPLLRKNFACAEARPSTDKEKEMNDDQSRGGTLDYSQTSSPPHRNDGSSGR